MCFWWYHYSVVIMSATVSQITDVSRVYPTDCSDADQRKHQSSTSLTFVRGIRRWPLNSSHKGPVTRKMIPFDDVIMMHFIVFLINSVQFPVTMPTLKRSDSYTYTVSLPWHWHKEIYSLSISLPGRRFNIITVFPRMGISIIRIRRSWDRLIFIMWITIPVRRHL